MAINLKQALEQLRKESKKRKFDQTIDLVINLKGIDVRKQSVNVVVDLPHKVKDKRVCGFLTAKSDLIKTITKLEFQKFKDAKALRALVNEFDFFIAHASLMPSVAMTFGKALGPAGKMPSPQLGIITKEDEETIKPLLNKISKSAKIRIKEASVKMPVGKESTSDNDLEDNIKAIYNAVINTLPNKKENVKNVSIKFTMSKPIKIDM